MLQTFQPFLPAMESKKKLLTEKLFEECNRINFQFSSTVDNRNKKSWHFLF